LDISGIILAGGKGLRLGRDKVSETVGSTTLLQRAVSNLSLFDCDVIIVFAKEQSLPQSIAYPRLRIVTDIYPGKGVLGGIYTGLVASESRYNLVVACDMPFLNHGLLRYVIELSPGFDAVVPRLGNMVEPLHAVYSKGCLASIESLLKQGRLSVMELFNLVRVRYVEAEEIARFDPRHLSFFNINTQTDLKLAQELAKDLTACNK
jgi:molybdopterin-guanine dinucleotide biosynthesis protein A